MSSHVHAALRKRFAPPEFAYFEEVRNGTGYARRTVRTADALAMGLYPSRGLHMHGFEVKVSRGDWLREKADPEKAEEISRFCDFWWLVTDEGVVLDAIEVPLTWGWLELKGKKLMTRREAPKAKAQPLDQLMLAAILRNASQTTNAQVEAGVRAQLDERMATERDQNSEQRAALNARMAATQADYDATVTLLGELGRVLGVSFFEGGYGYRSKLKPLDEEMKRRLELFGQSDVKVLQRQLVDVADRLRDASRQARATLRNAGVKPSKRLRHW